MSVLVIPKFAGDSATLRQGRSERTAEFQSAEQFQRFFADPELQAFIATTGARPEPPQIIVADALTVPQY